MEVKNEVGEIKKRGRKPRKQAEKEILNEYITMETDIFISQKKIYENMQYLSYKERQGFEQKFTNLIFYIHFIYILNLLFYTYFLRVLVEMTDL